MSKGIRNSLIEEMGEKPSKPLSVRCCMCRHARRHPEMGPEGPCQQELLEKTFVKRGKGEWPLGSQELLGWGMFIGTSAGCRDV